MNKKLKLHFLLQSYQTLRLQQFTSSSLFSARIRKKIIIEKHSPICQIYVCVCFYRMTSDPYPQYLAQKTKQFKLHKIYFFFILFKSRRQKQYIFSRVNRASASLYVLVQQSMFSPKFDFQPITCLIRPPQLSLVEVNKGNSFQVTSLTQKNQGGKCCCKLPVRETARYLTS